MGQTRASAAHETKFIAIENVNEKKGQRPVQTADLKM